jgi:hypothetical protein
MSKFWYSAMLCYLGRPLFAALFVFGGLPGFEIERPIHDGAADDHYRRLFYLNVVASSDAGILTGRLAKQLEAQAAHRITGVR